MKFLALLRKKNTERRTEWRKRLPDAIFSINRFSAIYASNELGGEVGELQNEVKKYERKVAGMDYHRTRAEIRQSIEDEAADVLICLDLLCIEFGIDLEAVTKRKFNATSDRHGFETRFEGGE